MIKGWLYCLESVFLVEVGAAQNELGVVYPATRGDVYYALRGGRVGRHLPHPESNTNTYATVHLPAFRPVSFPLLRHPAIFNAWGGTAQESAQAVLSPCRTFPTLVAHLDTTDGQAAIAATAPPPPPPPLPTPPSAHTRAFLKPEITPEDMADEPESDGIISAISAVPPKLLAKLLSPAITVPESP